MVIHTKTSPNRSYIPSPLGEQKHERWLQQSPALPCRLLEEAPTWPPRWELGSPGTWPIPAMCFLLSPSPNQPLKGPVLAAVQDLLVHTIVFAPNEVSHTKAREWGKHVRYSSSVQLKHRKSCLFSSHPMNAPSEDVPIQPLNTHAILGTGCPCFFPQRSGTRIRSLAQCLGEASCSQGMPRAASATARVHRREGHASRAFLIVYLTAKQGCSKPLLSGFGGCTSLEWCCLQPLPF